MSLENESGRVQAPTIRPRRSIRHRFRSDLPITNDKDRR